MRLYQHPLSLARILPLAVLSNTGIAGVLWLASPSPFWDYWVVSNCIGLSICVLEVAQAAGHSQVVFVTAFEQFAVAAFEQAAVDYLLKPVSDERLAQSIARLQRQTRPTPGLEPLLQQLLARQTPERLRWIRASQGVHLHLVDVHEVLYFQADDKYTLVMTREREYLIRTPLKELLPQLDPEEFWQIHRSSVVNIHAIRDIQRELTGRLTLTLKQRPETLTVSRAFAARFRQM